MSKAEPKYQIENMVAMRATYRAMVQQSDFRIPEVEKELKVNPCHIYMICHRPRISFNPSNVIINDKTISGSFFIDKGECKEEHHYEKPNPANLRIVNYSLEKPYTSIDLYNEEGRVVSGGKAAYLYPRMFNQYNECLDLEVLYIGQAFGHNGERLASDRLQSHSTLQEIYSDTMSRNPEKEVWLLLWQFEPYFISMLGAGFENALVGLDESIVHYNYVINSSISLDQQITFTEAALIKYFQPKYNKEYKTTFPSETHSSYDECYKLDVNAVGFELETVGIITRLYSPVVHPSFLHHKHFPLYTENTRRDMFSLLQAD